MYAEQYQAPASLETPAQWLSWAQSSVQGVVTPSSDAETNTRYNLNQFWQAAAAIPYPTAEESAALTRMNWWADQTWGTLADKLQWSTNDATARAAYAAEAVLARQKAAALNPAKVGNLNYSTDSQTLLKNALDNALQAKTGAIDSSYGTAFSDATKNLVNTQWMGIPVWAWGVGGVLLLILLARN